MRKIFNGLQSAPERAVQAGLHSRIWKLLLAFPCFAAAVAVSPAAAQNLSARAMRSRDLAEIVHTKPEAISHPLENQQESVPRTPRLSASGLDETASSQPQVFYEDGLLEILAENSALSDILAAVREKTGADIELPASAAGERIYARIGPGPARKVLGALLNLTDLDFVIQAPEMDAQGIQRVLLTQRLKAGAGTNGKMDASASQSARMPVRRAPGLGTGRPDPVSVAPENSGSAAPDPTVPDQAAPTAQQPASSDPLAAAPSAAQAAVAATASDSDSSQPATKTSEQMMQDLQNLYQLRRQQMQQLQPVTQTKKP
jgi:hypothetical protein